MDELGLECSHLPLFGIVSRFAEQKGIGLLADTIESFLDAKQLQLVVLGEGDPELVERLIHIHNSYPSLVSVQVGYNAGLAHRIEAGSDFFLMPSRFEPCGLNQMYSLRYGSIPVAHAVGGLVDTVRDKPSKLGLANGIKFNHFTKEAFQTAISSAIDIYHDQEKLGNMIRAGMRDDYSWRQSAQTYGKIARNIHRHQHI
jgi:starch synthase